jgi:hypothetical protein
MLVLVDGALEARPSGPPSFSTMFNNLGIRRQPSSVETHVAMGDGQQWPDQPLQAVNATSPPTAITGANAFSGTDGPAWDDHTLAISPSFVPDGTNKLGLSFATGGDSLLWSYSALAINE